LFYRDDYALFAERYTDQRCKEYWIGGRRKEKNSETYVWKFHPSSKYNQVMKFTNWRYYEPDFTREEEYCVGMTPSWKYKWQDVLCSKKQCVICEIG